jgi:hypothetical protein
MTIKGTFVSIWDNGSVRTPAILDLETGEITTDAVETEDLGTLMEEWFEESETGEEHEICPECHEYILHNLDEVRRCKNPDCDYMRFVR